ncbi:hypothetical protein [Mesorhizobium sp. M1D.F.Ca.ET.234.01.1.1]|uniref:hypothetical protein n=1 Tax=Mesorhizobium sp. M1D.F.Ca.ET.234.01.1.1 TaxID=2563932 RepID=UPI000FD583B5|nr:hypothetical protein [Mesorhizobium sp. M1D.F.Ca.ET.234.01.1.1]
MPVLTRHPILNARYGLVMGRLLQQPRQVLEVHRLGIFEQLQEVGRLAARQPTTLQGGDARALALDVALGLQDMPFRHLDIVVQRHGPKRPGGQRVPQGKALKRGPDGENPIRYAA